MQIYNGKLDYGQTAKNANGGTEIMARKITSLNQKLLKEFQIVISRVENELDPEKIRIYYAHDLPGDPAAEHLRNDGHDKFHKLVFVSNWQMQAYINHYHLPWSKCIVMQNAIKPIEFPEGKFVQQKTNGGKAASAVDKIKLIYTPTPHRGLELLVPVFQKLCEKYDNLELDVYSSFDLYGWAERNAHYEPLFEQCRNDPKINYHGSRFNEVIRDALQQAHIFAYPSIWPETSCLSLIEAMSAGCVCVHSNYGALAETSANWTHMYHFNEDKNEHAKIFYTVLTNAIEDIQSNPASVESRLRTQKSYTDIFYSWEPNRRTQWEALFHMLLDTVKTRAIEVPSFVYRV